MTTINTLHDRWQELLPGTPWPGDTQQAVELLATELRALRVTLDAASFAALESPELRDPREIRRAHDLFMWLLLDSEICKVAISPASVPLMQAAFDALCWCLHHQDHGGTFAKNLAGIEERLRSQGFGIVDMGRVIDPRI